MPYLRDTDLAVLMEPRLRPLRETIRPSGKTNERTTPSSEAKASSASASIPILSHVPRSGEPESGELSAELRELLQSVVDEPLLNATQRRDRLAASTWKFDQVKKAAVAEGLAEEVSINLGHATRGIVKFLELTTKGFAALGLAPPLTRPQNVSAEHWWWQRQIARSAKERGLEAEIEMLLNGKRADVGVSVGTRLYAFEVAITPNNEAANAIKDLYAGFDRVVIAAKNARVRAAVIERLRGALSAQQHSRVTVALLSDQLFATELS